MLRIFVVIICTLITNFALSMPCRIAGAQTLVVQITSQAYDIDAIQKIGFEYAEKNAIKIIYEIPVHFEKLFAAAAAKAPSADVIMGLPHDMLPTLKALDGIEELDLYVKEERNNYVNLGIEAMTIDQKLYGIPLSIDTQLLICNEELIPTPPKTWEELENQARTLENQGKDGLLFNATNIITSWCFLSAFGMTTETLEQAKDPINNAATINGINFIKDLGRKHVIELGKASYNHVLGLFQYGQAGMIIEGSWALEHFTKKGIPWKAVPIPPIEANKIPKPLVYVDGIVVNKFSKNKDLAIEFSKYLTKAENLEKIWAQKYWAPGNTKLIEKLRQTGEHIPALTVLYQSENGQLYPKSPKLKGILDPVNKALTRILLEDENPEKALQQVQDIMQKMWK